jgi:hypothetical protein
MLCWPAGIRRSGCSWLRNRGRCPLERREVWSARLYSVGCGLVGDVPGGLVVVIGVRPPAYCGGVHGEQMAEEFPVVGLDNDALRAVELLASRRLPGLIVVGEDGYPYACCRRRRW